MKAVTYNEKLIFVTTHGDLSETGFLYQKYCCDFEEWYGDSTPEDLMGLTGYPVGDFREWFISREIAPCFIEKGWEPEILEKHLDEKIERIIMLV